MTTHDCADQLVDVPAKIEANAAAYFQDDYAPLHWSEASAEQQDRYRAIAAEILAGALGLTWHGGTDVR